MKILIFTCNTGGGHNSTAKALEQRFVAEGHTCDIVNFLSFAPKAVADTITGGHRFVVRYFPKLFGMGYRYEENHPPKFIQQQCASLADDVHDYIVKTSPDAVISVHVFSSMGMAAMRKKYGMTIPSYFVATDYTCSPGVPDLAADKYFVPVGCREDFEQHHVPSQRIVETGIPVGSHFDEKQDKTEARRILGLPETGRMVLLMCGSWGCGPMQELTLRMSKEMPEDAFLCVLCGNNKILLDALKLCNYPNVFPIGFTDRAALYMDAADLFMSKPGGISSTEAFHKRVPLLIMEAIPGCETRNLEFFLKKGYAVVAKNAKDLIKKVCYLLDHPQETDSILENVERDFNFSATDRIFDEVVK